MIGSITPPSARNFDMWVIYRHPRDYPDHYVARLWSGNEPSLNMFVLADTLAELQRNMLMAGRLRLERMPSDEPHIVEVWI